MNNRLLGSLFILLAAGLAVGGWFDASSEAHGQEAFKRTLVTFAVARTLDGVISVAQGTAVAVEPAGVGVNFTVGQILDPINDLVERFSAVMLIAASSVGLQNFLLSMTSAGIVTIAVVGSGLVALVLLWWPSAPAQARQWSLRLFLGLVFVRFAVGLLVIVSNSLFGYFLEEEQAAATAALETTSAAVENLSADPGPAEAPDDSLMGRLGAMVDESFAALDARERIARLKTQVSGATEHIVNLIVIFMLQTVLLPLLTLWLLVEFTKGILRRAAGNQ